MSKKSRYPQTARHVLIYDEDWEYLETRFGPAGLKPIGVSNVIRALIHNKILALREAENIAMTDARRETTINLQHEKGTSTYGIPADLDSPGGSGS